MDLQSNRQKRNQQTVFIPAMKTPVLWDVILRAVLSRDALFICTTIVLTALLVQEKASKGQPLFLQSAEPCASFFSSSSSSSSRFHVATFGFPGPVPWDWVRPNVQNLFTMGGQVAVTHSFFAIDAKDSGAKEFVWKSAEIDKLRQLAAERNPSGPPVSAYGLNTTVAFYDAFEKFPLLGKSVLIIGSQVPWLEAMCLAYHASSITTVDFNKPVVDYPGLKQITIEELDATDETFDIVLSYSSLEHDGLGRYGDPLNPIGDLLRMKKIKGLLSPEGIFFLGVPNGNDTLVWNGHRVYGPMRMPKLIEGYKVLGVFGVNSLEEAYTQFTEGTYTQPVVVLKVDQ
eukprot:TRINITY_DN2965_c0_g3_i1.p1 TRINITY_DN2965_c0_g3~~TRINITY_DN2965_c0_g3_i1.p1  ORF type:complete len:343 (-),score=4.82 TRINITY_DN2965_c0_g3_i1:179-1207(-)